MAKVSSEGFAFAAFRSRQQVAAFEALMKRKGISCRLINTPIEIGMGCGFSLRFSTNDLQAAVQMSKQQPLPALIGFYSVEISNGKMEYKQAITTISKNKRC